MRSLQTQIIGDADNLAAGIEEGAAGVAGVDGAVGLNEAHGGAGLGLNIPAQGADNTAGQGEGQLAEGVADGVDVLADAQRVGIAQGNRLQILSVNLDDGDVVACIITDDLCIVGVVIIGRDRDGLGTADDVVVGENIAVAGDDETGAGGLVGVTVTVAAGGFTADGDADGGVDVLLIEICRGELRSLSEGGLVPAADGDTARNQAGEKDKTQGLLKERIGRNRGCFHGSETSFRLIF